MPLASTVLLHDQTTAAADYCAFISAPRFRVQWFERNKDREHWVLNIQPHLLLPLHCVFGYLLPDVSLKKSFARPSRQRK